MAHAGGEHCRNFAHCLSVSSIWWCQGQHFGQGRMRLPPFKLCCPKIPWVRALLQGEDELEAQTSVVFCTSARWELSGTQSSDGTLKAPQTDPKTTGILKWKRRVVVTEDFDSNNQMPYLLIFSGNALNCSPWTANGARMSGPLPLLL